MKTPETRAMRERARELMTEAYRLKREADAIETREERINEIKQRKRTIANAARLANSGFEDSHLITHLMQALDLARSDATATLEFERSRHARSDKARRNREIMRYARRGWTNAEIARHFGLSEKHVSRLVGDALDRVIANAAFYDRREHIAGRRPLPAAPQEENP